MEQLIYINDNFISLDSIFFYFISFHPPLDIQR